ncbi:phytanoyl-CoA dioxygenase family protein [Paractinoplanes rishiriensis]|uniref:Phytanoyl-CoA dioxygenase n=1 Tax=Paractinoplanes rishiriensis TaxID=1050105 RepID=A0A919JU37_9ACTN|nr:phytanoyl-CoA dioxygenase family protein [Actinoplanes rishiriensis]GIE95221.1 hypothetical protein Ari01nite_26860 [Actinoplanes rishiriensis]
MNSIDDQIYSLQTLGFAYFRQAIPPDLLRRVKQTIADLIAQEERTLGVDLLESIDQRGAIRNLCDCDPVFSELADMNPVYPVVDQVVGEVSIAAFDALGLMPGRSRFPWDFHTDLIPFNRTANPPENSFGATCLYYLDDAGPETGATWIVPGSQRCMLPDLPVELMEQRAEQVVVQAGDLVLFDARLWHCTSFNAGTNTRWIIKQMMIWPSLRPMMDYTRAVRPEVKAGLPDRVRQLIGTAPPASVEELRGLTEVGGMH